MNLPTPGQRYPFTGRGVVTVLGVTRTDVSYKVETPDAEPHFSIKPHAEFLTLPQATLQAAIAANLETINEDTEV